jgi:GWxTD domain-containing protein
MNEITELIDPIRYISTSTEYKNLKAAVNPKKGLDAFWLKLGKNEENSKELLKKYYRRIETANQFFTSYKEGWKTDRGIIYIIYGVPNSIRKNEDQEVCKIQILPS